MELWWGPFIQSRRCMSLKFTEGFVLWQWRMIQNLRRNWLVSSKLTWGIRRILTRALQNLKNLHFNGLLLNKVYNVWAKKSASGSLLMALNIDATWGIWQILTRALENPKILHFKLCLMALKIDAKFEGKLTCAFYRFFVYSLKNSDFILESKMAELSWKQNLLIQFENCQDVPYSHE